MCKFWACEIRFRGQPRDSFIFQNMIVSISSGLRFELVKVTGKILKASRSGQGYVPRAINSVEGSLNQSVFEDFTLLLSRHFARFQVTDQVDSTIGP